MSWIHILMVLRGSSPFLEHRLPDWFHKQLLPLSSLVCFILGCSFLFGVHLCLGNARALADKQANDHGNAQTSGWKSKTLVNHRLVAVRRMPKIWWFSTSPWWIGFLRFHSGTGSASQETHISEENILGDSVLRELRGCTWVWVLI